MKTSFIALLTVGGLLLGNNLLANEGHQVADKAKKSALKQQTNCPIMTGNKINKKLYVDTNGKRIYVCCKGCIAKVKQSPEKYLKKLQASGQQAATILKTQTNCPVMKANKINKKLYIDVKGKRIYVCCKGCLPMVKRNPEKYLKQLKKNGVAVANIPTAKK